MDRSADHLHARKDAAMVGAETRPNPWVGAWELVWRTWLMTVAGGVVVGPLFFSLGRFLLPYDNEVALTTSADAVVVGIVFSAPFGILLGIPVAGSTWLLTRLFIREYPGRWAAYRQFALICIVSAEIWITGVISLGIPLGGPAIALLALPVAVVAAALSGFVIRPAIRRRSRTLDGQPGNC